MADASRIPDRGGAARLVELAVADPPEAWAAAGFTVEGDRARIGDTTIHLIGRDGSGKGIVGWTLAGLIGQEQASIDGLATRFEEPGSDVDGGAPGHPNGVIGIDHVVVMTPDLDRTIAALGAAGLACRRIRHTDSYGSPMRQAFFRLGLVVLEVVGGATGSGQSVSERPASWFGLALDVDDLDHTVQLLGEGLGPPKVAVQEGRRIATLRHKTFGMSVAVAAMDHHADR